MSIIRQTRIIAFANQKGGVGKTTCVANLGAALNRAGKGVLMIDLDPQAHLSASFGIDGDEHQFSAQNILSAKSEAYGLVEMPRVTAVRGKPGLHLIPSSLELAGVEFQIANEVGREGILKNYLENVTRNITWAYILIDCPPSLGVLTLNALTASREVIIPLQPEFLPLRGVSGLVETIERVRERVNSQLEITGVVATRVDARKVLARDIIGKINDYFGTKVFKTRIRENIALAEAPGHGQSIFEYDEKSRGAEDFEKLAAEIIKQEEGD